MKTQMGHYSFKAVLNHLAKQDPAEKIRIAFNLWQFAKDLQDKGMTYERRKTNTPRSAA